MKSQFNTQRIIFSTNGPGTTTHPYEKKKSYLTTYTKIDSNYINIKDKTIKFLDENIGEKSLWSHVR